MNARLVGKTIEGQDDMSKFEIGERATIGRSAGNAIVIEDPAISGQHASIVFDAEEKCYFLEDLKSLNGTELDGMRVKERERLGRLHVITLAGSRDLIFQDLDLCAPAEAASRPAPSVPAPAPAPRVEKAAPVAPPPASGEGTRVEEGGFVLPESMADVESAEGTRIEEGDFALPKSVADVDSGEGTRVEEGGFKLPGSVAGGDSGEGTRVEEGGFKLPGSMAGGDSGEGTRVEEGGFKLPGSMAGGGQSGAVEKVPSEEDTGETTIQTGPSGVARVSFRLEVPELALSFTLEEGENLIGRAEDAAVRINLADISRRHAVITVRGDKVTVRDEGSSNKTFIDDREVGPEPVELLAGDVLMFGDVKASLLRG